ncbi:MAG: GNAT family N-acetyltransferase [Novosphingobium sp.]|uniref:GNAT family N-acetyltransferase n=1 Tax=Tsuneonella sp. CC-YZS046 TaxID=3042152 RepID=UPI002D770600|nr:GNAT family N-acetyltransferase [Tsuneonella sp. CC-YZS046]WRO65172.1 GNAT family N-acetyltransferase [Tsuneonella sp. CC-YZS046]
MRADAASGDPRLREIRPAELGDRAFLDCWDALAATASEPNPFYESWYLLPSLRALDPQKRVKILVLEAAGIPLALMPISRSMTYYGNPLPHLRNWTHANCFLGCPLVAQGAEIAFWQSLIDWADENAGYALFFHLAHLPLSGRLHRALRDLLVERGRPAALVFREERAMLASDNSADAYLEQALSGKKRKELRRQHKRLAEQGALDFTREPGRDGLDRWIEDFLQLEMRGWKGKAGSALGCADATATLFREALAGASAAGRLERLSLTLDGRPIAMLANFLCPPGAFSYKTAFDENYARFSPGVLLQRENLALLGHERIEWCDSCATADHPMIDHIWRERRAIGRISFGIGGAARQSVFRQIARLETGTNTGSIG